MQEYAETVATLAAALKYYADENSYVDASGTLPIECDGGEVARDAIEHADAQIRDVATRTAAVKNILAFYADEHNYAPDISEVTGVTPGTGVMEYDISNIEADAGERARDALRLINGSEGAEIRDMVTLTAVFRDIVDRATPAAAVLYTDFHTALETALIQSDNEFKTVNNGRGA